ncbi:MAG: hypothetical protein H0W68_00425, partial [Gemmatimonadaceae bacterium]|nr:hypothetical protein [Gemmatimonadaceae bacterium]
MRRTLKWIGYGLGGLLTLLFITGIAVYGLSEARFRRNYIVTPEVVPARTDAATMARGEHLVEA